MQSLITKYSLRLTYFRSARPPKPIPLYSRHCISTFRSSLDPHFKTFPFLLKGTYSSSTVYYNKFFISYFLISVNRFFGFLGFSGCSSAFRLNCNFLLLFLTFPVCIRVYQIPRIRCMARLTPAMPIQQQNPIKIGLPPVLTSFTRLV